MFGEVVSEPKDGLHRQSSPLLVRTGRRNYKPNPIFFLKILSPLLGPRKKTHLGRKRPPLEERSVQRGHFASQPRS